MTTLQILLSFKAYLIPSTNLICNGGAQICIPLWKRFNCVCVCHKNTLSSLKVAI